MDWGDSCVSHPYFSLVATLRHVDDQGISHAFLDAWGGDEETLLVARRTESVAQWASRARDLSNRPPNDLTPERLADRAAAIAQGSAELAYESITAKLQRLLVES